MFKQFPLCSKFHIHNSKAKMWYLLPHYMYSFFVRFQAQMWYFVPHFVFLRRAPVSILFQFHPIACPRIPSSLSERNHRAELIKHSHAERKNKRKGWGLWGFCLFFSAFSLKIKERKCVDNIYTQFVICFILCCFCVYCLAWC